MVGALRNFGLNRVALPNAVIGCVGKKDCGCSQLSLNGSNLSPETGPRQSVVSGDRGPVGEVADRETDGGGEVRRQSAGIGLYGGDAPAANNRGNHAAVAQESPSSSERKFVHPRELDLVRLIKRRDGFEQPQIVHVARSRGGRVAIGQQLRDLVGSLHGQPRSHPLVELDH